MGTLLAHQLPSHQLGATCAFATTMTHLLAPLDMKELLDNARLLGVRYLGTLHDLLVMQSPQQFVNKLCRVLGRVPIQWTTFLVLEMGPASLQEHVWRD